MLKPEDIAAIFEWIELLLIANLKRNLARHKDEEEQEGFTWSAWQAEKLRSVNVFRRQCKSIMDRYTDVIDSETRQLLEEQFEEGVNGAAKELEEARAEKAAPAALPAAEEQQTPAENPEQGHSETSKKSSVEKATAEPAVVAEVNPEPQFFGVDKAKTEKLIEDVTNIEEQAETAALRLTDDVYRQTVNRVQLAMATGSISYAKAVDMAVADFLAQGINCIEYKDGRRVNIADYVRMVLRTTSTRAALQGESESWKARGYDTVQVSSYGMCSKTCLPWQGRAYINDAFTDWSGETKLENGIKYGKSNYCGKWFPLLSSAIEHGLFHPNCRHGLGLHIEGVTEFPEPMDNSEIERRYKAEQAQRALEREVRKAKRKVEGSLAPEDVKKAKAELAEAQKNVRDHINKTNASEGDTVLVRKPLQEKIYGGDVYIGSDADPVYGPKSPPESVPEGYAVDVDVAAPKQSTPAQYTEEKIPERFKSAETEKPVEETQNHNESVDISEKSDIIEEKAEETAETEVHNIGKINLDIYKCVTDDIRTDEVIITDSQIEHIKERHPNDYERFGMYFKEIVENPDYIIEANKPNTALILKEIIENGEKFKTVLRLVTSTDNPEYKNSIITFMKIAEKDWKRILKNKKILYKSE
ncbi:MAG: hypothetical protein IKP25_05265 [Ruminococcus sp.]|nr:hypothetical protein [Ruminococcus sp.]